MQIQADVLGVDGEPPGRRRDDRARRGVRGRAGGRVLGRHRRAARQLARGRRWAPHWTDEQREAGYARWSKAVERTLDWVDVELEDCRDPSTVARAIAQRAAIERLRLAARSSTCWSSAAAWSAPAARSTRPPAACRSGWSRRGTSPRGTSSRSSKLIHGGLRYLEMLDFRLVAEALQRARPADARLAPHLVRPVPFLYPLHAPRLGARLRRAGRRALRRHGAASGTSRGVPRHRHLTRRARCESSRRCARTRCRGAIQYYDAQVDDARHTMLLARTAAALRRARRVAAPGRRVPARGRAGRRGPRRATSRPAREFEIRARQVVNATGVWTDDTQAHGRRARPVPRPRVQGHPPGRAARPDPLASRADPAHREVGALRHPVGPALDHRHHRHRLGAGQGPPGGDAGPTSTTCSTTSTRVLATPLTQRGRRGRVRRAAAAALGRVRADVQALARARRRAPGAGAGRGRGRQVHDLPGDGQGRRRRGRARRSAAPGARRRDRARSRCWAPTGYPAVWNQRARARRSEPGCTSAAIEHLLGRYGSLVHEVLDLVAERPDARRAARRARRTTCGPRSSTRRPTRARGTSTDVLTRRTRISIETFDRGVGGRERGGGARGARAGLGRGARAQEVGDYRERVEAERESQTMPDDAAADEARRRAPDVSI